MEYIKVIWTLIKPYDQIPEFSCGTMVNVILDNGNKIKLMEKELYFFKLEECYLAILKTIKFMVQQL